MSATPTPNRPNENLPRTEANQASETAHPEAILLKERVKLLERETALLRRSLENGRQDFRLFKEVEARLSQRCKEQEAEIQVLKAKRAQPASNTEDSLKQAEIRRLKKAEANLHEICAGQEVEIVRLKAENKDLSARVSELSQETSVQKEALRSQASEVCALREKDASAQVQLQRQIAELARLQEDIAAGIHETEELREALAARAAELEDQKLFRKKVAQHERDMKRLRAYAVALGREKKEVLLAAKKLAENLRESRTLHPLKDYLELTEFELRKAEVQLKKAPASSPERPRLEAALAQILEQRDFLRRVIETSERELEQQAEAVTKIARVSRAGSVPPPPPKIQDASEA